MRPLLLPLVALLVTACPHPPPSPGEPPGTYPGVVQCASQAVQQNWPKVLPAVNQCLVSSADGTWVDCLLGLINPAVGVTEDVIACLVRDQQSKFADAATRNPSDGNSARAAIRAQRFLSDRRYNFVVP